MFMKNHLKITLILLLFIGISQSAQAQFWKKLKKKVQNKIEQKVDAKIDKETDRVIDETLDGKKENEEKSESNLDSKSYGTASVNHSALYGTVLIDDITKTIVEKKGKQVRIYGYWNTFGVDVHDGYNVVLNNVDDIDNLQNQTFKIPEEASVRLDYDALVKGRFQFDQKERASQIALKFITGSVTVTFNKDKNVAVNFYGSVKLKDHKIERKEGDYSTEGDTPANLTGIINTTEPEYKIVKKPKEKAVNTINSELTEPDKEYIKENLSPTVNIPNSFAFNKSIEVKMTDDSGESQTIEFLTGSYPDIYGMSIATKEMQGQQMLIVTTPKSTSMFMNMAGMKIKKSMSLDQIGSQYNMENNLPEDGDFEYKKTGNTKKIVGYLCEEYKVNYDYSNSKGSASFWISQDFPVQNKAIPMLGMKLNNPNFSGFVLEMNTTQQGKIFTVEVTNVSDKSVKINTNEYKSTGF